MRSAVALALAGLCACSLDQDAPTDLGPSATSFVEDKDLPVPTIRRVDMLFVIDDSPAIAPYQASLRANLPQFAGVLNTIQGGLPSLHAGFVAGDDPVMHGGSGVVGPYIESVPQFDGPRRDNYADLGMAYAALGDLGTAGSPDQPLLATAVRALIDPRNGGFRRSNADLFVVVIAPSDDHSLASIDTLAAQIAVVGLPPHVFVGGISPRSAPRVTAFLDAFPNRSTQVDIADEDLSDALVLVASSFGPTIGSPCMYDTLVDSDPVAPGLQPVCTVSDVQHPGRPERTEQVLPACDAAASVRPCWRIAVDAESCPTGAGLALEVPRFDFAPDDDHVIAQCEAR